ncbi:MAG: MMPL family transporter [Prolixibacteraceae bacterium]|nr:MMPL family transporter [Prolixibacteraceae bacterium]
MENFFVRIYDFFEKHKTLFFLLLVGSMLFMLFFSLKINFREDISSFFFEKKKAGRDAVIFTDFKMKDRMAVIFSSADTLHPDPDFLIEKSQQFEKILNNRAGRTLINQIISEINADRISQTVDFIYANLPVFMVDADYRYLDSIAQPDALEQKMIRNYHSVVSPMGMITQEVIRKDPLGVGNRILAQLSIFNQYENYKIYDGHIFTDNGDLLIFIDPRYGMSNTSDNDKLITIIENTITDITSLTNNQLNIEYYGGPSVAVYNARQIKKDMYTTVNIALIVIILFILLTFKNKRAVSLIVFPVIYGGLFALCGICFFVGQISSIAIGAGAAVLGIALSYSIHVISHSNHVADVRQIIKDLAKPLTIGSFTTIGAFLALLFTSSPLLRDFGLFSSLSLIGTTLFCLIFLPHFIKNAPESTREPWLLRKIEKLNSYHPEKNKWLIAALMAVTVVSLFFFNDVKFNSDMMLLNYEPEKLKNTRDKLEKITGGDSDGIMLIAASRDAGTAQEAYARIGENLSGAIKSGEVEKFVSASSFVPPPNLQRVRIETWNNYLTAERKNLLLQNLNSEAMKQGFAPDSFFEFSAILNKKYAPQDLSQTKAFNASFGD